MYGYDQRNDFRYWEFMTNRISAQTGVSFRTIADLIATASQIGALTSKSMILADNTINGLTNGLTVIQAYMILDERRETAKAGQ